MIELPSVPQNGYKRLTLPDEESSRLLRRRRDADYTDLFATDPNPDVRELGRLILRRDLPYVGDYLELADVCARLSLQRVGNGSDPQLMIFYVGKTLQAYRKALTLDSTNPVIGESLSRYLQWLMRVARSLPTQRNIATALWAAAEDVPGGSTVFTPAELERLLVWYVNPPTAKNPTPAPDTTPSPDLRMGLTQDALGESLESEVRPSPFAPRPPQGKKDKFEVETQGNLDEPALSMLSNMQVHLPPDETRSGESVSIDIEPSDAHQSMESPPIIVRQKPDERDDFVNNGRIAERFEVKQKFSGGMGSVYLCYDTKDRIPVAIKTFQSKFLNNERAVTRFTHEALTWIRLEKHRHIVQALKVQKWNGRPYIILEHISGPEGLGPDLRSWIDHNRLDLETAITFGLQIALGMQHATQKMPDMVHRDLKPGNILVHHDMIAKVTDFGLVRSLDFDDLPDDNSDAADGHQRLTRVGAVVGTAPYMS
ncbi:MAG: serine/threonine protein kinase, partial [Anaerolineae bacterium]